MLGTVLRSASTCKPFPGNYTEEENGLKKRCFSTGLPKAKGTHLRGPTVWDERNWTRRCFGGKCLC